MRPLALLALLFLVLQAPAARAAKASTPDAGASLPAHERDGARGFDVEPVPAWVERVDVGDGQAERAGGEAAGGVRFLLSDEQVHLADVHAIYTHRVKRIVSPAGVEASAELRFTFSPVYERLVFHAIRIRRPGKDIDALSAGAVRVLDLEPDEEHRIYSGQLTALVVLRDLRVGDTLDVEYSRLGSNPVLAGFFSHVSALASGYPSARTRVRLLAPEARRIAFALDGAPAMAPTVRTRGEERESVWERRDVPAVDLEGDTPSWFEPVPTLTMADAATWEDIARWASKVYAPPAMPAPEVEALVTDLRARHPAGSYAQALAAIRFVQDEVRYLGIEMGESSHRPHPPEVVLGQRYGDCKDKALLLVTLLRALGLQADVALVNTEREAHIAERPPSPNAFDHAIVCVRLNGRTLWIDATKSQDGGTLADVPPPPYGRALVIAPDTRDLEPVAAPPATRALVEAKERFVTAKDGSTSLTVQTAFREDEATRMRHVLTSTPVAELQKDYLNYYAQSFSGITVNGRLGWTDDRAANLITVRESYRIPKLWEGREADVEASAVLANVRRPRVTLRSSPLAVSHPLFVREEIVVEWPGHDLAVPHDLSLSDDALLFTLRGHAEEGLARIEYELRSRADSVAPAGVAAHLAMRDAMRDAMRGSVEDVTRSDGVSWTGIGVTFGIFAGIVGVVVGVKLVPRALRKRRFKRDARASAGEVAERAIPVGDRGEAELLMIRAACDCGAVLPRPIEESAWTSVRLGEQILTLVRATCAACGATRRRYFAVRS